MKPKPKSELTYKSLARFIEMTFEALHKEIHDTQVAPAHKALAAILAKPSGCIYCDSGELRLPPKFQHARPDQKHEATCGFGMAEQIVAPSKDINARAAT